MNILTDEEDLKKCHSPRTRIKRKPKGISNKDKIEGLKKIYKNPIKIVKLKIDNTIDYEVSPIGKSLSDVSH